MEDSRDPTRKQIQKMTAEIRKKWSEGKRRQRRVQAEHGPWQPPKVKADEVIEAFVESKL